MIDDPSSWHNWHDRISTAAIIIAGISATAVGIWRLATFTRKYATKEYLAIQLVLQEEKGRKELEMCNTVVQSKIDTLTLTNDTTHSALDDKLDTVIDLVKVNR